MRRAMNFDYGDVDWSLPSRTDHPGRVASPVRSIVTIRATSSPEVRMPSRPDCREIDRAGFLAPGQSRDTGVFEAARACVYHDHFRIGTPAFEGRITIQ